MFQFFAGDLYEVIPKTATKFLAADKVDGRCEAKTDGLSIYKNNHTTFNVSINFDCELSISRSKISDFKVNLQAVVEGFPDSDHIDFYVVGHGRSVQFFTYDGYEVTNLELAELMISHSLNRMVEEKVFGSDWPLFSKDYPHFIVQDNYTVVYDSTHVDPETSHLLFQQ